MYGISLTDRWIDIEHVRVSGSPAQNVSGIQGTRTPFHQGTTSHVHVEPSEVFHLTEFVPFSKRVCQATIFAEICVRFCSGFYPPAFGLVGESFWTVTKPSGPFALTARVSLQTTAAVFGWTCERAADKREDWITAVPRGSLRSRTVWVRRAK